MSTRSEIEWAPRVSLRHVRELYQREAQGNLDDEFLDEVGFALYARCLSILEFSEAVAGRVRCKRCYRNGSDQWIDRQSRKGNEMLRCSSCGWQIRWRVYLAESEKVDGQLHQGNAGEAFRRYVARYPLCSGPEEKILAIDRLIHEFHWNLAAESQTVTPWKPAGVNLLRGTTTQVVEMLNELTYGEQTPQALLESYAHWREQKPIARRLDSSTH